MALYKCQMCGGELIKNQDGAYECLCCGTLQTFDDTAKPIEDLLANSSASAIDNVYRSAVNAMTIREYESAIRMFTAVQGYRDADKKLEFCRTALDEGIIESIYTNACAIQASAKSEKDYQNASLLYSKIIDYKDSSALKVQCDGFANSLHKEEVYKQACKLMEDDSLAFLQQSIELFNSLSEYKDSKEKALESAARYADLKAEIENHQALVNEIRKAESIKKKNKNRIKRIIILSVLTVIALSIFSVVTLKKIAHSVNDIEIKIINSVSKHDSRYYYVYMDFNILNNTGSTIDYIQVTTYFTDKSGKSIGVMTSEYGSQYGNSTLNLKSKQSIIKETYLSEYQSSSSYGTLFTELYNCGIDDLAITYEITCVKWHDDYIYQR